MNNEQTSRFKDAPWFTNKEVTCVVGGAGGISSWLTVMLARAGFQLIVYDFDTIEEHNMAGQLYDSKSIGKLKVEALSDIVYNFTSTAINAMAEKYDSDSIKHKYMFSGFDNMQARKDMFNNFIIYVNSLKEDGGSETPIFIDGRLSAEQLQIFCVTPDKIEEYKKHLFNDDEVEDAPCTFKQTSHAAAMIASHMVGFFTNHYTNNVIGEIVRDVPFKWEYFIANDFLKVE